MREHDAFPKGPVRRVRERQEPELLGPEQLLLLGPEQLTPALPGPERLVPERQEPGLPELVPEQLEPG